MGRAGLNRGMAGVLYPVAASLSTLVENRWRYWPSGRSIIRVAGRGRVGEQLLLHRLDNLFPAAGRNRSARRIQLRLLEHRRRALVVHGGKSRRHLSVQNLKMRRHERVARIG